MTVGFRLQAVLVPSYVCHRMPIMYKLLKTRIQICSVNGFPSMERGNGKRAGITPINLPIFYAAVEWKRIGINPASPFPQNHTRNRQRNFITYPPLQFHLLTGGDDGGENSAGASGGTQNTHIQLLVNRIVQPCQPVAGGPPKRLPAALGAAGSQITLRAALLWSRTACGLGVPPARG